MRVGIVGGGQLGWMTILEGRKLGFSFFVLDPSPNAPASKIADLWFPPERVEDFIKTCDVITYEFEHISQEVFEKLYDLTTPSLSILELKRSRIKEKEFYKSKGYPTPEFTHASYEELMQKIKDFGLPCVVKAEKQGYDGKGQYRVEGFQDLERVLKNHSPGERFLIEKLIDFSFEFSLIGVRDIKGNVKLYPITVNHNERGVLLYNYTRSFSIQEASQVIVSLTEDLNLVGLLAVEFFYTWDGKVLINEMAPRPHNTGHYSLDGAYTSQFENLLRAICSLPLGSTHLKCPSGMVNILGLSLEELDLGSLLSMEGVKLYWYGKSKRHGRKMGHINVCASTEQEVEEKIEKILHTVYHHEPS
ncbi:MAG: 5-(carboxyamino)imidazole ribonucleotide synthase [Aquificota bacterium]|nr:MAG: 5-(carboxyamino)imidazole ribonucleotide synthase [Aquificota bacterium]